MLITGKCENGKTFLAKLISDYWNQKIKEKNNSDEENYFCICTENINCWDLIGRFQINEDLSQNNEKIEQKKKELMKWVDGFLLEGVKKGRCVILDQIEEAPSTISERLNSLLDKKYDEAINYFYVNENPKNRKIKINENFRLICTCDDINKMSPAFVNRFDIIYFEDQLSTINEKELKSFIIYMIDKTYKSFKNHNNEKEENKIIKELNDSYPKEILNIISQKKINCKLNVSFLNKICRTTMIYHNFFHKYMIEKPKIVNFSFEMITNISKFEIDDSIKKILLNDKYFSNESNNEEQKFFYKN